MVVVVVSALYALFQMQRLFFSMVALRENSCTFVLRCKRTAQPISVEFYVSSTRCQSIWRFYPGSAGFAWASGGFSWVAYPLDQAGAWTSAGFGGRW